MEEKVLYRYINIDLEQFASFEENLRPEAGPLKVYTETTFHYDKEGRILRNRLSVAYSQEGATVMKAVIIGDFVIHEDSAARLTGEDGKTTFPVSLLVQFASLNYGTLRGVLYMKTAGTPLSKYILPPLRFNEIIQSGYVAE